MLNVNWPLKNTGKVLSSCQPSTGNADLMGHSEADARINIDELLRAADWDPADKSQVLTEQKTDNGRADYVLLDRHGQPLAVIEAKKDRINPYTAKQQALPYAKDVDAPFIFLSNGDLIYFWDYQNDDARKVESFYSQQDLERVVKMRSQAKPMAEIPIPEHYLRQSESRSLRPYQIEAMQALDHAVELGKRRFLIQLPTGTGKTDLTCLYVRRLMEARRARRVLFLVDRDQLAKQAVEALNDLLGDQYGVYWRKSGTVKQEKMATVCLLQTMISSYREYTSGYFDVVIADECHRSIYGNWKNALMYFDAIHIGLTATPSQQIERNTFEFYNCKKQTPDFTYSFQDAVKNRYLVPYRFAKGITSIIADGADNDDEHLDPAAFEKNWTNKHTNQLMMKKFDELAWEKYQELAPGQKVGPGKAIVFAITKQHAARLAEYLNKLHPEHKGDYAHVITSDIPDASEAIRRFKEEDYPQVAVSVGMLDTGFDCREVLHLVMCRRVRSPILYQQMRGRGTRTAPHIDKRGFVIYDFFRNSEYFNDSDEDFFTGEGWGSGGGGGRRREGGERELIELGLQDEWLEHVHYVEVGPEGERIDKKDYITEWQKIVRADKDDAALQKIRNDELLTEAEERKLTDRLNTPRYFFNEDNLRKAYRDPGGTIIDFIKEALGLVRVKSREEKIQENFQAWLVSKKLTPEQASYLSLLKNRGVAKGHVELDELFAPPLSLVNAGGRGVELFGTDGLKQIVDEMNANLFSESA